MQHILDTPTLDDRLKCSQTLDSPSKLSHRLSASPFVSPNTLPASDASGGLSPPPPAHYLRSKGVSESGAKLLRQRSELYSRAQHHHRASLVQPLETNLDTEGLLFGKEFHSQWGHDRTGRPRASSDTSFMVPCTPSRPQSPQLHTTSKTFQSPSTNLDDRHPRPLSISSALIETAPPTSYPRPPSSPLRAIFRGRFSRVRDRSVDSLQSELVAALNRHASKSHVPSSPSTSSTSTVYDATVHIGVPDVEIIERQNRSRTQSPETTVAGTPTSPHEELAKQQSYISLCQKRLSSSTFVDFCKPSQRVTSPPSPLADAQKLRRMRAFDHFTQYTDNMPYQRCESARESPADEEPKENVEQANANRSVHRTHSLPELKPRATGVDILPQEFGAAPPREGDSSPIAKSLSRTSGVHRKTSTVIGGIKSLLSVTRGSHSGKRS